MFILIEEMFNDGSIYARLGNTDRSHFGDKSNTQVKGRDFLWLRKALSINNMLPVFTKSDEEPLSPKYTAKCQRLNNYLILGDIRLKIVTYYKT